MNLEKSILLLFTLACNYCTAQYYSVNDPDGYVNIRLKPDINSEIVCKLPNTTIVYETYDEDADPKANWLYVDFYLPKKPGKRNKTNSSPEIMDDYSLYSGYIYRSKLTDIEKLKKLKYKQLENGYSCFNDSIKLTVLISPFIVSSHKIKYNKDGFVEKIDNLPMIGTDETMPRTEISTITMSINNIPAVIPQKSFRNLFEPSYNNYTYIDEKGTIYLVMYNSDAAGSYSCIFIFRNGKFVERLVFMCNC